MKYRRMAILFVMVTLAGSPPVWDKVGGFFSAIQQKAQTKFLSMVLSPGTEEVVLSDAPTMVDEQLAYCSKTTHGLARNVRSAEPRSNLKQAKSGRRDSTAPEELNTLAFDDAATKEALSHLDKPAPELPNRLAMHPLAAVPGDLSIDANDVLEFVVLPKETSEVPALLEKANIQLKLRKAFEDKRATGRKTRYVIASPLIVFPASKVEVLNVERAG